MIVFLDVQEKEVSLDDMFAECVMIFFKEKRS